MFLLMYLMPIILLTFNGVADSRRTVESLARLAFEHGARVNEQAGCQEPKPQLIYFNEPTKVIPVISNLN